MRRCPTEPTCLNTKSVDNVLSVLLGVSNPSRVVFSYHCIAETKGKGNKQILAFIPCRMRSSAKTSTVSKGTERLCRMFTSVPLYPHCGINRFPYHTSKKCHRNEYHEHEQRGRALFSFRDLPGTMSWASHAQLLVRLFTSHERRRSSLSILP